MGERQEAMGQIVKAEGKTKTIRAWSFELFCFYLLIFYL